MVFTANAGLVDGSDILLAAMRHPERTDETAHVRRWALAAGHTVSELPPGVVLEGIGDCLPLEGALVAGHGVRSSREAHAVLAARTGRPVVGVHLADPRWYHVDLTLCPLGEGRAIVHPDAWDADGARQVLDLLREPLLLSAAEAATFCANSVVVDSTIIMPACPPRVGRQLQAWGYDVVTVDVGEFLKAGGAVRCLTLPLDTVLSAPAVDAPEAVLVR
jgi:ornithine--oxo-acid transaminase